MTPCKTAWCHMYAVRVGGETGYISGAYTASTLEAATEIYDRFGVYTVHAAREDRYGGGDAGSLDYYPRAKGEFEDNVMPSEVRALYMTCDADVIAQVDDFIAYADSTGINAFVVNVIDGTSVGYPCEAYQDLFAHGEQLCQQHAGGILCRHPEDPRRGLLCDRAHHGF